MSWNPLLAPGYPDAVGVDAIERLIVPRVHDLGDFEVRRALRPRGRLPGNGSHETGRSDRRDMA
jgi:hypothetical protein